MNTRKVIGLDLSITGTGIAAVIDGAITGTDVIRCPKWAKKAPATEEQRHERLDEVLTRIAEWTLDASLVVVEGLAFDAHDTMRQLAGLSWLVRYRLWKAGAPVALVPPSKVKLYATGKGQGADKLAMVRAADKRFPGVEIEDDNAADALWLAAMGARHLGMPVDDVPQAHVAALTGATWPAVGEVAA